MLLPSLEKMGASAEAMASIERILPSKVSRNVAVIADTAWTAASAPTVQAANQAIPFFCILMGFTSRGHAVWIPPVRCGAPD